MTEQGISNFDWNSIERETKLKGELTSNELLKLGYDPNIKELYNSTLDRISYIPHKDLIVTGVVREINNNTAVLDINYTEDAYLEIDKENSEYREYITEGSEVSVKVINNPNKKGYISVSFTSAVEKMKYQQIYDSIGENVAYMGYVHSLLPGGYLVKIEGVDTFMPGSLAGANKLHDFSIILGKELPVKPVNFDRNNIVVSHRDYLKTLIPTKIEELKENLNEEITGKVTGTTKNAVFCEFNECLTGRILVADLTDEYKERHRKNNITPGETITFYAKNIINDRKIVLTQTIKNNPWKDIDSRYTIPAKVKGTITNIKKYGAFIQIEDDVIGLLHQSEIEDKDLREGQEIGVVINRIDKQTKKIFLKLS